MVEDFTREVRAPVDLVIEAVREETKEWREPAIPPEVRKLGVARMKAIVQPPYFRLWLWHPGGSEEAPAMVRAVVIPTPDGGSRLRGEIGRRLRSRVAFALPLLAFVALAWTTGGVVTLVIASVISIVVALMGMAWRATLPSGSDPEADYLMQRLAHALAAAEEKAALTAATQPGALPPSRAASRKSPARTPWKRA